MASSRGLIRYLLVSLIGIVIGGIFLLPVNVLEQFFLDVRISLAILGTDEGESSDEIVLVLMDGLSEKELGVPAGSEWRQFFPLFIEKLYDAGAAAVVFDLEFLTQEAEFDTALADTAAEYGRVIAGEYEFGSTTDTLIDSFYGIGSLRVEAFNGVPRRVPFLKGSERPPISILAAGILSDDMVSETITQNQGFWISYNHPMGYFTTFSFSEVLNASEGRIADSRRTPLSIVQGKVVLVGMDLPGIDRHPFPNTLRRKIPGVYGQAFAIDTILSGSQLDTIP
ncbi:MAG: CHASE2 domain-containing protein, partial [Spirochaetales bacterium]|nr:CHASE2 domain-containing protein [Spirochaetales bacterium]